MGKRLDPAEGIAEIKRRLTAKYWNMSFTLDDWFFPGDLSPHSARFKYMCKKLYALGLLERTESYGRWGWRYHIPQSRE